MLSQCLVDLSLSFFTQLFAHVHQSLLLRLDVLSGLNLFLQVEDRICGLNQVRGCLPGEVSDEDLKLASFWLWLGYLKVAHHVAQLWIATRLLLHVGLDLVSCSLVPLLLFRHGFLRLRLLGRRC